MKKETVLITGVSRGIGLETARRFLDAGYEVIGIGRNHPDDSFFFQQANFKFIACDLALESERKELKNHLGQITVDLFIHSAMPSIVHGPHVTLEHQSLQEAFEVGIHAALEIVTVIGKKMRAQKFGRIVFLGSAVQMTGSSGQTAYQTIKSAQEGLVKSLCSELAEHGITVNQFLLGLVLTPGLTEKTSEEQRVGLLDLIPGKSYVEFDQIFELLQYILSKASAPLNGAMIPFAYGAQWKSKK